MASNYSTNLKIELIASGEQAGTWGTTTNTNLGTALEEAIVGYGNPNFTSDADLTLTLSNSNATQIARNFVLNVTSGVSLTATRNLIVPTSEKPYVVQNNTTGSQSIIVKTSGGSGVTVPNGKSALVYADGTNVVSQVDHIPSLTLGSALPVASGGTGATSLTANNVILGNGTSAVQAVAPGVDNNVLRSNGTTWVSEALGSMADQNSNSVSITGGSISGITDLAVADGGTGASTDSAARVNLGVEIGVDVQAYDADLTAIGALAKTDGNFIVGNGTTWVAESGSTARTSLGLGSIATQNSNSVSITGGSISGITDLAVADGGTGASTASGARTNLGVAIGSDVQAYDADLTAIGALAKTDGNFIVGNGTTWVAESGSTARTSLGLGSLATLSTVNNSNWSGTDLAVANGGTGASDAATARTNLGVAIGSDVQAYDADLTAIGALAKTDGNFIVGNGSTWVAESGSTARTSLGLGSIATQNANAIAITGGDATGLTSFGTSGFTITQSGTKLVISYGATAILSISSTGVITALSNVVSNGTP